jgi:hydrogenase-4 component E
MTDPTYTHVLNLICGGLLLSSVLILSRRQMLAVVRLLAVQGALLAALAAVLGVQQGDLELCVAAAGVLVLKAIVLPGLLYRVMSRNGGAGEGESLVNVPASLVAAAFLTLLAYAVSRPLVSLAPSPATQAVPVGMALVFLGFFVLVTRRHALSQVAGFLVLDNGITATAFLATAGVPPVVELGVSLDLLLLVLVLQILSARMRSKFGRTDLDDLRELRG